MGETDITSNNYLTNDLSPKTRGVLSMLDIDYTKGSDDREFWLLSEKETICMHNCAKSYVELKDFIHTQVLRDYSYVRDKNRKLFESM